MQRVVEVLLSERAPSLRMRPVTFRVITMAEHDPGAARHAAELLRECGLLFRHSIVLFDHEGCGRRESPEELEQEHEEALGKVGLGGKGIAVCISPELETWLWSSSPLVYEELRMSKEGIDSVLDGAGIPRDPTSGKPSRPREAVEAVLRRTNRRFSATLHVAIAEKVGLGRCTDPAFIRFRQFLQERFGAKSGLGPS